MIARMRIPRWLGATALAASLGCSSTGNRSDGGADAGLGDASSVEAACVTGPVADVATFVLTAAPGNSGYCLGAPGTCSGQWLFIRAADGGALPIDAICQPQCGSCEPVACSKDCAVPSPLGDDGAMVSWNGTYYPSGTCGAGTACFDQACAPPGDYVATFCAYAEAPDSSAFECTGASAPTCVETPFVWPPPAGSSPVQGVLAAPGADAGS
jgi:hypothetical protein